MNSRTFNPQPGRASSGKFGDLKMTKKYFFVRPLRSAATALENSRESTLAEMRLSSKARQNVETELANIEHEVAILRAELARYDKAPVDGLSQGLGEAAYKVK